MSRRYRDTPKSEMDAQRELLDTLMGINRNQDRAEDEVTDFRDERVCKFFLAGVCPHDMFTNTKCDEGQCQKYHSEDLKKDFEEAGDLYLYDSFIEREFTNRVTEMDRNIRRARARVEEEKGDENIDPVNNPDVLRLQGEIGRLCDDAAVAVEKDDIDKAQELMLSADKLQSERFSIINKLNEQRRALMQRTGVDVNKKLRVCDVCGSYLSILDSDKRLADHFLGKQHIGYQLLREYLDEINKRKDAKRGGAGVAAAPGSTTTAGEKGDREREPRDRSRDRGDRRSSRSRDRFRDRSRDRDTRRRDRGDSRDRRRGGGGWDDSRGGGGGGSGKGYDWDRGGGRDRGGGGGRQQRGDSRDRDYRRG